MECITASSSLTLCHPVETASETLPLFYITRKLVHQKTKTKYFLFCHCDHDCQLQCGVHLIFTMRGSGILLTVVWVIYFVCLWVVMLTVFFTVSGGFEGGLSRLLRKQMSTLQRLICLIRLPAFSIPTFIYLLTYLLTYSFTYLCLDLVWFPPPTPPTANPLLFLSPLSSLASISKISLQRRGDNIH